MGLMEASATREIQMQILRNQERLEEIFAQLDPQDSGELII